MKWIIVLALAAACSTKKPETSATETDAKPVAPQEVKSCLCNKIFMPVCADGINYGNSCEAECHGHKKWTEGSCASPKK